MAIVFDNARDPSYVAGTTQTFSYTVGSGSDRILIAFSVTIGSDAVTSLTYNGAAMTLLSKMADHDGYQYIHYLLNPPSGSHNVVLTTSTTQNIATWVASYAGVDQSAPEAYSITNSSSLSISSVTPGAWILAHLSSHTAPDPSMGGDIVNVRDDRSDSYQQGGDTGIITSPSSKNFTYPGGTNYALSAVSIKPSISGRVKIWDGSSFKLKPVKIWNGSSWVTKQAKIWNGSNWV